LKGDPYMKKVIVVMLALALFAAQGIACAEDVVADVQAQADDMVEETLDAEDLIMDESDEMMLVEETEEVVPVEAEGQKGLI
jgi:hypothetical protein